MQYILLLHLALNLEAGGAVHINDATVEIGATRQELAANPLLSVRRNVVRVLFYPQAEEEKRRNERVRRFKIARTHRERAANSRVTATQTVENQANDRDISQTSPRHLPDISETSPTQQSKMPKVEPISPASSEPEKENLQKRDPSVYTKEYTLPTVPQCITEKEYKSWNGRGVGDARGRGEGNELLPNWAQTLRFRLRNGEHWTMTGELLETLRSVHKESDIRDQSRLAAVWLETNPAKRKTASGMPNFLAKWLNRSRGMQK